VAEIGLQAGCDDIGSTMMEENVVSQAGAPTAQKWSMSPEELEAHIHQAGFIPALRDSAFKILKAGGSLQGELDANEPNNHNDSVSNG
jgi:cyclic dehypoxanthinyl futalosine synthase